MDDDGFSSHEERWLASDAQLYYAQPDHSTRNLVIGALVTSVIFVALLIGGLIILRAIVG